MPARHYHLDQFAWHEEARAIVLHGVCWVDESVAEQMKWAFVLNPRDGHYYSKYGLLNGLLVVPALALELAITGELPSEATSRFNHDRIVIIDLLYVSLSVCVALVLWMVSGWYIESDFKRLLFVLMTLYCTTLWYYLRYPSSELTQVGLFLLFWLFFLLFSRRAPNGRG